MEYEFVNDITTGSVKAKFSFEHQSIGTWLEIELGQDIVQLTKVLEAVDLITNGQRHEIILTGKEYSVIMNNLDVLFQANTMLNGEVNLPDELNTDDLYLDDNTMSSCGIDDFRELLLSWARFTKD